MSRFADEDAAFLASVAGLHNRIETLKTVYAGDHRKLFALAAMQQAMGKLAAAATSAVARERG